MFKRACYRFLGTVFLILGLIGLLVPILPGFLFLILALLCLTAPMEGGAVRPPYASGQGWRSSWRESRSLPLYRRAQLAFWLAAAAMVDAVRVRPPGQER